MATVRFGSEVIPEIKQATLTPSVCSGNRLSVRQIIQTFFPLAVRELLLTSAVNLEELQEIRCRVNQPLLLCGSNQQETMLLAQGLSRENLDYIVQRINQCSVYAWEEEYRRGYLTLPGGHRVGLAGKIVLAHGEIRTMKAISSLNFRIAREVKGAADRVLPFIVENQQVLNTLIVAPPGCGKTTLLRDIVRQLSDGLSLDLPAGITVGVVDERSELAGTVDGAAQLDLGKRTDVLDGCPKALGMSMMIRAMSPKVLVTDEIGTKEDVAALEEALNAGIAVIASLHGQDRSDLEQRPHFNQLLQQHFFRKIIFLSRRNGVGTIEQVIDSKDAGFGQIKN